MPFRPMQPPYWALQCSWRPCQAQPALQLLRAASQWALPAHTTLNMTAVVRSWGDVHAGPFFHYGLSTWPNFTH